MFTESSNGMNRIVGIFLAFIAILGTVAPPARSQEQAQCADNLVDFLSINTHLMRTDALYFELCKY